MVTYYQVMPTFSQKNDFHTPHEIPLIERGLQKRVAIALRDAGTPPTSEAAQRPNPQDSESQGMVAGELCRAHRACP